MDRNAVADSDIDGNKVKVDIGKNNVIGKCCENSLNIRTNVRFCSDLNCTSEIASPYIF